jgi:hypothetical protein
MLHLPTHTERRHLKCRFLQISWIIDFCTCFMNRLKCHLLQLVLTNWFTFWSKGGMWCLLEILPITLQRRGQELKSCMSSEVLGNLFAPVVEENGGKNRYVCSHSPVSESKESLSQSIHTSGIDQVRCLQRGWREESPSVPQKEKGRSNWVYSMQWELGSGDDGCVAEEVTYTEPEVSDLTKPFAVMRKFLIDTQYVFTCEGIRVHHCSWYRWLTRDNRRQERVSAGVNKGSAYFQPAGCLGQQDLRVWHRWVEDIQVVWAPWDSYVDWGDENWSHEVPGSYWLHQVIRGKSPNSCPSERLFSIFNATYKDDQ